MCSCGWQGRSAPNSRQSFRRHFLIKTKVGPKLNTAQPPLGSRIRNADFKKSGTIFVGISYTLASWATAFRTDTAGHHLLAIQSTGDGYSVVFHCVSRIKITNIHTQNGKATIQFGETFSCRFKNLFWESLSRTE